MKRITIAVLAVLLSIGAFYFVGKKVEYAKSYGSVGKTISTHISLSPPRDSSWTIVNDSTTTTSLSKSVVYDVRILNLKEVIDFEIATNAFGDTLRKDTLQVSSRVDTLRQDSTIVRSEPLRIAVQLVTISLDESDETSESRTRMLAEFEKELRKGFELRKCSFVSIEPNPDDPGKGVVSAFKKGCNFYFYLIAVNQEGTADGWELTAYAGPTQKSVNKDGSFRPKYFLGFGKYGSGNFLSRVRMFVEEVKFANDHQML